MSSTVIDRLDACNTGQIAAGMCKQPVANRIWQGLSVGGARHRKTHTITKTAPHPPKPNTETPTPQLRKPNLRQAPNHAVIARPQAVAIQDGGKREASAKWTRRTGLLRYARNDEGRGAVMR